MFAEGTSQNNGLCTKGQPYYFRKSAACVKGLHFGITFHCLKRILNLPQGADGFEEKYYFPHFSQGIS